jgi:site-specific DNA recombinase
VGRMKRATHLFTGMLKCGTCGGGFIQVGKQYYGCANTRNKGTYGNRLTIKREDFETRVLSGLRDPLLHPELIAEYVRAYQAEFNKLSGSIRADRQANEREMAKVTRQIDQMVNAIAEGMFHPSMKDKMTALESSKAALTAKLRDASTVAPCPAAPRTGGSLSSPGGGPDGSVAKRQHDGRGDVDHSQPVDRDPADPAGWRACD